MLTTTGLLGMFIQCGLNNSVQRFYWDETTSTSDRPSLVSSAFLIQLVIGLVVLISSFLILFIISKYVSFMSSTISVIAIASAITLMVFKIWFLYILDITRLHLAPYRFLTISFFSKVLCTILACYAVVCLGWGLDGFLSIQAFIMVGLFPIVCFFIKKDLTLKISKVWCLETFKFGYPFIFAGIGFWLLGTIDRWMLTFFTSLEEVGIYSVAVRFSSIILFISTAFGMAWGPIAIKIKSENPNDYKKIYSDLLVLFLFGILLVSCIVGLFSGEIIHMFMGDSYNDSAVALIFLSFGVGLFGTQQITAVGISLEKKTYLFSRIAWCSLILNVILNYFLIPLYGSKGASISTLFCYFMITVCYFLLSQKLHKLVFDKSKLLFLLSMGLVILGTSLHYLNYSFYYNIVMQKMVFILVFCTIGFYIIKNNLLRTLMFYRC